jgi:hypothetical protein
MAIIYRKTDLGQAEIATRALKLPPRLRQALIVVDGKRDLEELRKLMPPPAEEVLQSLLELDCIEPATPAAPSPVAAPVAAAPPPAVAAIVLTVPETRQRAVRWLSNALGPYADPLNLRIEKVKTPEGMRPALVLAASFVRQQLGAARAAEFEQHVGLPPSGS